MQQGLRDLEMSGSSMPGWLLDVADAAQRVGAREAAERAIALIFDALDALAHVSSVLAEADDSGSWNSHTCC